MPDVLVVEDDPAIQEMVGHALALADIPYRTADDGQAALRQVSQQRPRPILLHLHLPVMNGVQFCAALDVSYGRGDTAIIVMTAAGTVRDYRQQCRADGVLAKPFDLADLDAVLQQYLPPRHPGRPAVS